MRLSCSAWFAHELHSDNICAANESDVALFVAKMNIVVVLGVIMSHNASFALKVVIFQYRNFDFRFRSISILFLAHNCGFDSIQFDSSRQLYIGLPYHYYGNCN